LAEHSGILIAIIDSLLAAGLFFFVFFFALRRAPSPPAKRGGNLSHLRHLILAGRIVPEKKRWKGIIGVIHEATYSAFGTRGWRNIVANKAWPTRAVLLWGKPYQKPTRKKTRSGPVQAIHFLGRSQPRGRKVDSAGREAPGVLRVLDCFEKKEWSLIHGWARWRVIGGPLSKREFANGNWHISGHYSGVNIHLTAGPE